MKRTLPIAANGCSIAIKCLFSVSKEQFSLPVQSSCTNKTRGRNNTGKRFREMKTEAGEFQYNTAVKKRVCVRGKNEGKCKFSGVIKP